MSNAIINRLSTTKGVKRMSDYQYKYNARKTAYDTKYVKEHYDVYNLKMPIGMKDKLKELASSKGLSVNQYLVELIKEQL